MLHRSTHRSSSVDGGVLCATADKMVTGSRAGQVALGHVFIVIMLELSRVVRRILGGFSSRCIRSDTDTPTHHDAVHGLRAAPEPDAALCEAVEVSQFVALVQ